MWKLTAKLPKTCVVAISGGADSVGALHFLARDGKRKVFAAMFDHGTGIHEEAYPIVERLCADLGVVLSVGKISKDMPAGASPEQFWREERYAWLNQFSAPVITAHNLDDTIETYLMGCCHGNPKMIPFTRGNVIRPFLAVSHDEFVKYCSKNNLRYFDDPSNKDARFSRTRVRYELKGAAELVNPGFRQMMKRKVVRSYSSIG